MFGSGLFDSSGLREFGQILRERERESVRVGSSTYNAISPRLAMRIELRTWSSRFREEREELALVVVAAVVVLVRTAEPRRGPPVRRREVSAMGSERSSMMLPED